jgi:Restriction endonuclease fold toxin 5
LIRLGAGVLAGGAAAVAFLGTLMLPSRIGAVTRGTLPERTDISFRYDDTSRGLEIYQRGADGQQRLVFSGQANPEDNLFRNEAGEPIGMRLETGVIIDPYAFPGYLADADDDARGGSATRAQARAEARRDTPQLCPDATPENINGRSDQALAYQAQIAHLPVGFEVVFRLVRFDGCDEADGGKLREAKGEHYARFMTGPDSWQPWYRGLAEAQEQMWRQHEAAKDRIVEWHFAEKAPADYFRAYAAAKGWDHIRVFHTPPVIQLTHEDMYKIYVRCIVGGPWRGLSIPLSNGTARHSLLPLSRPATAAP